MVGVGEEEGGRGPAAVSQADMNAALEEFAAAASNKPADENHLLNVNLLGMLMAVSAAAVPAEDLGTTIKQAATAVFAHFSESPTNWCAEPLLAPRARWFHTTSVSNHKQPTRGASTCKPVVQLSMIL